MSVNTVSLRMRALFLMFSVCALIFAIAPRSALAANTFVVDDQANLMTKEERDRLKADFQDLTEYANVAVLTADNHGGLGGRTAKDYAENYVKYNYLNDTAIVFLIDMYTREVTVYANKAGLKIVSTADARTITDNIYTYATNGDYYGCADEALSEIRAVAEGAKIARPMKHITSFLVAVTFGILINFAIAYGSRSRHINRTATAAELRNMAWLPTVTDMTYTCVRTQTITTRSSGGGGFGGGGGGGGGYSGGGGGSHNF